MRQATEQEPRRLRPERRAEGDLLPLPRRHGEDVVRASDLAAGPDGEAAHAIAFVVHVAPDVAAGARFAAQEMGRGDTVAAGQVDRSGCGDGRREEADSDEKRQEQPGMNHAPTARALRAARAYARANSQRYPESEAAQNRIAR